MLLEDVCRSRTTSVILMIHRLPRYKEGRVAKDMLIRCAEDAACKATSEMNAITNQLLQNAALRDQRMAERDAVPAEKLAAL